MKSLLTVLGASNCVLDIDGGFGFNSTGQTHLLHPPSSGLQKRTDVDNL